MTPAPDTPRGLPVLLLVEDHPDTRQMYAECLSDAFDVITAGDGRQALDMLQTRRPDLVITDLSLPRLDGFELVAEIRKDRSLRSIPVVCLSGFGGHVHEERARNAGCDMVLQKPCLPDALAEIALDLLRTRDGRIQA